MDEITMSQIQIWREKCRQGTMTQADYKEAIAVIRAGRTMASAASTKSKTARAAGKAKANVNSDDLLGELEGL